MEREKEERFSIHIRTWGAGLVVWIIGFTTILVVAESLWWSFLYLMLVPAGWAIWYNEKLPGGIEK